jgi:UDP-2-acetamido-3-amino-2,3-dideoxy-glucuronate N-acetyltransferase
MPKVAVVGCGYWGKNLVRVFRELDVLDTVCEKSLDILNIFKKKYPEINLESNIKYILDSKEITAVAIATPAITHYSLVKQALLAGKDVFVEKPLSLKVKEGEELVKIAKKAKRILMVGHILQYHPAVTKLKDIIVAGGLGDIQYIYSNRLNIGKLRTEENILWSFAPHDISTIMMLLDQQPTHVYSFGEDYITKGIYDTTMTTLEFKNNIKGHVFVSWIHPYKEQKLVVVGSKAMAVFDDISKEKLVIYQHKIEYIDGKIPVAKKAEHKVVPVGDGEPLSLELQHFIECIKKRKNPKTDGNEGLRVLKVLKAAELSLVKKRG